MPEETMEQRMKKMMEARRQMRLRLGDEINLAIPMYEDPTRYPVEQLRDLFVFQNDMMNEKDPEKQLEMKKVFRAMREKIQLLPDAPDRIYLWDEDNMPVEKPYTENPDFRYDHEPDFRPYMLELLVPEDVQPRGAVALVAGGTHGAGTMNECYEVGLELNEAGYHAFILQCRPNGGPYTKLETATDAARAFRLIRKNAEKYRIDPSHLAYAGFSNGGVTGDFCIRFYSQGQAVKDYFPDYRPDEADEYPGGPNAFLCVYGARHVGTEYPEEGVDYPPTFFAIGRFDYGCIRNLFECHLPWLQRHNGVYEIHTFAGHPHGFAGWKIIDGKGDPNFDLWITHAAVFLNDAFDVERWIRPNF